MCHDDESRPPASPTRLGGSTGKDIVLTASDGAEILAYIAEPEVPRPQSSQIVIFPDARGMSPFYKELAQRFAEIGLRAITIDYFARTTSTRDVRDESFDFYPHVYQLKIDNTILDTTAALDYLHSTGNGAGKPTFVVGFCLGGTTSLLVNAVEWDSKYNVRGVMPFYASVSRKGFFGLEGSPLDKLTADSSYYPVLGSFAGADEHIPVSDVENLEAVLKGKNIYVDIKVYEGAPHSFFDRKFQEFAEAAKDSWNRIGAFVDKFEV